MGSLRWNRDTFGSLFLEVLEPGQIDWVHYSKSQFYVEDADFSKGFATFQNCLRHKFKVIAGTKHSSLTNKGE